MQWRSIARAFGGLASLFGGLALANAGLGAVHGFASPIGGMYSIPHGAVCAALLVPVMEINRRALSVRHPGTEFLRRFDELGALLTGNLNANAHEGIEWLRTLRGMLKIPALSDLGVKRSDHPELASKAAQASSMKSNPLPLTREELLEILERA